MRHFWLTAGLLLMCAAFVWAQDTQSTTTTPTTTTTQSGEAATSNAPATNPPQGTQVTRTEQGTEVQPVKKPVKVTPSVVKAAQQKLQAEGYNPGPADAVMGPKTGAALREFQAKNGLKTTGRLDQETMAKLDVGGPQEIGAAPADLGRGGKAFGHDIKGGHPEAAGKAIAHGSANFGKKVGQGTKSEAVTVKNDVGKGLSKAGKKVERKKDSNNPNNNPQ